jgi:hypothetical protein
MSATKTQLIGGQFQDSQGNLLALGYLTMRLSSDENVSGVGQVAAGIVATVNLGATGAVSTSPAQSVWANDVMTPVNSFYVVTGYTAQGQLAWGPNNQQVTSGGVGGGTFDTGTWVPNTVVSWSYPAVYGPTGPTGGSGGAGATGATGATGGAGVSLKKQVTVLTTAQLLAATTIFINITETPASGSRIVPAWLSVQYHFNSVDFGATGTLTFFWGASPNAGFAYRPINGNGFMNPGDGVDRFGQCDAYSEADTGISMPATVVNGLPITVGNGAAAFNSGNGSVIVTAFYTVEPIV